VIALCDELHATSRVTPETWSALRAAFSEAQILELIALAGFYRTVAYFACGLELEAEAFGTPLPC
jgi:alkylhydroperoxidase family enzyme